MDKRICRRSEIDPNWADHGDDWSVDLATSDMFTLDCVWHFRTKRDATEFLALVDGGMDALQAAAEVLPT